MSTQFPTPAELRALGLEGSTLEGTAFLPWPEDAAGRGAGRPVAAVGLAALLSGASVPQFAVVGLPFAPGTGVQLDVAANRIVRIRVPEGQAMDVLTTGGSGTWGQPPGEPSTTYVDLAQSGPVALTLPGDEILVLRATDSGLAIEDRTPAVLSEAWLRGRLDSWLVAEMRSQLARADTWGRAAALGAYTRLALDTREARRVAQELVTGGATGPSTVRRWALTLSAEHLGELVDQASARVASMEATVAQLGERMAPREEAWVGELAALFLEREAVEGVSMVLHEAGADSRLREALDALDQKAEALIDSIPVVLRIDDEHLRRAAGTDPTAWWARLLEWERP